MLSWIAIIEIAKTEIKSFINSILGGIFVGLSLLSHPGVGLFSIVSFVIFFFSHNGFKSSKIKYLIISGFAGLLIILPWVSFVIFKHGPSPFLAGLSDSKSSINIFSNINIILANFKSTLGYIYNKHLGNRPEVITFIIFPFGLAIIFNFLKGPRVLILLLLAAIFTMRGNPSVTMFSLSASVGIFYEEIFKSFLQVNKVEIKEKIIKKNFIIIYSSYVAVLFLICFYYYVNRSSFTLGEQETYNWIQHNTDKSSTFITENLDEKLVYFGERTILLPILGAEWIPDPVYGNWTARNTFINNEIFKCREVECLYSIFNNFDLQPNYLIYQISDNSELEWIELLGNSPYFNIIFNSKYYIILEYLGFSQFS